MVNNLWELYRPEAFVEFPRAEDLARELDLTRQANELFSRDEAFALLGFPF